MAYEMTPEMEEAVITLIDERITATTTQQTRRIDRLENALVQLADAQRRSEERQDQTLETQRHISHQLYTLTNAVNNLTNVVHTMQQTQVAMQGDIHTLKENQRTLQENQRIMQGDIRTLKENQQTMQGDIRTLKENQQTMQGDIRTLKENQQTMQGDIRRLDNRVAQLVGDSLEERYSKHAAAYLGRALRKVKAFKPYVMEDQFREKLSEADYEDLLLVDLLVRGIPKGHKGIHVWLAFEISVVVDRKDVERAIRRADILRRAGFTGIPTVAGESLTQGAETLAAAREVVVVTNGKIENWDKALARALAAKG